MSGLPHHSCAYLAVFEALRGAEELETLQIDYRDNPTLISILMRFPYRNCKISFEKAIMETKKIAIQQQIELGQPEDAWLILKCLRQYLSGYSSSKYVPHIISCEHH
jgi:hypothetical protein